MSLPYFALANALEGPRGSGRTTAIISTAPKDGTPMLLRRGSAMYVGRWDQFGPTSDGGWASVTERTEEPFTVVVTFNGPTHWQPLPTPPKG